MRNYVYGFGLSLILTFAAYFAVTKDWQTGTAMLVSLAILAITQFFVQVWFFLHLGQETQPRWKLAVFVFMVGIVGILVFGSIWIMNNLNYHHPDSHKSSDTYIIKDEGISD